MAASGSTVYVVFGDSHIYFNRSLDGGVTWLAQDVQIDSHPTGGLAPSPKLAVAGSAIYVTWSDDRDGAFHVFFNRSLDGGTTWLAQDVRIDTEPTGMFACRFQEIAASGSSVYVTWYEWGDVFYSHVHFNRSLDGGLTWLPSSAQLDRGPGTLLFEVYPQIAASGSSVYVVWAEDRNGEYDVYLNRSLDGGATWLSTDLVLDTRPRGTGGSIGPRIAAQGSSVYVAWQEGRNNQSSIYCNRSLDSGTTWLSYDVRVDSAPPGPGERTSPEMVAAGASVYVVWQDTRSGNAADIYFSRSLDGGVSWSRPDTRLDTNPAGAAHSWPPKVAVTGSAIYATWQESRRANDDIYFNRSLDGGTTWLANDRRFDTDPLGASPSFSPDIAASGAWVYVVWSDVRNLNYGVYCNVPFALAPYGDGTAGSCGMVPRCVGSGVPVLGQVVSFDVANGLGGASGAMLIGGAGSRALDPGILFQGGRLHLTPAFAIPIGRLGGAGCGNGNLSIPLPIPANPALVGADLYFQPVFIDAGAPFGWSAANAVEMWIG